MGELAITIFRPNTVYQTIIQQLRDLITGKMEPDQKFLTERDIARKFRISRPTANKILTGLVSEGLLEFRKGVGTFVRQNTLGYDLKHLVSFTEKSKAAGKTPETRVLRFETLNSWHIDKTIMRRLSVQTEQPVYYFERLRLADGIPVIYERRYVPHRIIPHLQKKDLKGSLYALWTDAYELVISGAEQTIRAINLTKKEANRLEVAEGSAALLVTAVGKLVNNEPLWYEETIYRGDAYEFHAQLGGIDPGRPAVGRLKLKT